MQGTISVRASLLGRRLADGRVNAKAPQIWYRCTEELSGAASGDKAGVERPAM